MSQKRASKKVVSEVTMTEPTAISETEMVVTHGQRYVYNPDEWVQNIPVTPSSVAEAKTFKILPLKSTKTAPGMAWVRNPARWEAFMKSDHDEESALWAREAKAKAKKAEAEKKKAERALKAKISELTKDVKKAKPKSALHEIADEVYAKMMDIMRSRQARA